MAKDQEMIGPWQSASSRSYIAFTQRSLLMPWRVYRIVQKWTGSRWLVVSKTRWLVNE